MSQFDIKLKDIKHTLNTFNQDINTKIEQLENIINSLQLSIPSEQPPKPLNTDWTLDQSGAIVVATDGSGRIIDGVPRASYAVAYGTI